MAAEAKKRTEGPRPTDRSLSNSSSGSGNLASYKSGPGPLVIPPDKPGGEWQSFRSVYDREYQAAEDAACGPSSGFRRGTRGHAEDVLAGIENAVEEEMHRGWRRIRVSRRGGRSPPFTSTRSRPRFNAAVAKARELSDAALTYWDRLRIAVECDYNRVSPFFG